ncbi:patatin-like phospholipase family protein [Nitrospira defluvii]|uniref:PNPLA domain-containing protein n=1 Tax=Nitrospira defluvii TaxID=330214 RepID=A0ABM8QRQ8_9BACT|nr:patatin-like phospholipase family protein [Nitrospira defluvii]CAE6711763.1 PNPLA domain-containing protein [Nitrospira defluvii]
MSLLSGPFLGCWIAALLLTSVSCATSDPPRALPPDPRPAPTRATLQLGHKELTDGRFVGLAFSGGGSRAAVFGAAVMKELDRLGLLQQVDVLSAVSGGALPATAYALEGYRDFNFENGFVEQIGRDIQGAVAGPWYAAPHNLLRYAFRDTIPAEPVIRALDDQLFHGATFADLNPSRPILLLNATDAVTGDPLVIAEERFASLGIPLGPFSIARAVYMSAAYPGVLEPLTLTDGRTGTNGASADPVLAYDGGAADNLGIRTLIHVVEKTLSEQPMADRFPQGCLVISIDATSRPENEARTPLSAAAALLRGHRRNVLELAGIPAAQQDQAMFGTFRVGQNGSGGICRFWHVALRQLPDSDPLGEHVTHITTNLGLSVEDQAALIAAAARLVAKGREEMNATGGWAGLLENKPALFSHP